VTGAQFFRSSGAPTVLYQCLTSWPLTRSRQATVTPPSHPRVHPRRGPQQISMTSESTSTQRLENCVPLANVRIGTWVHSIECRAGKMVRAAGTSADTRDMARAGGCRNQATNQHRCKRNCQIVVKACANGE
jgi:hypothetical protein